MKMTKRERVIKALSHQNPDQVPIDIGSTACWFTEVAYERMKTFLGLTCQGELFRLGENAGIYDETLLDHLDTDFRHVYLKPSQKEWDAWNQSDKTIFVDEWGITRKLIPSAFGGSNWEKVTYPLMDTDDDAIDSYDWLNPADPARIEGLAEKIQRLYHETEYAIAARSVSHGFLETATELRGMEQFLVDMMTNKPYAHKLLQKILDVQIGLYSVMLDLVGPYVQVVQTADDYGTQKGPMISPKLYREMIMPYRKALNDFIRSKAPQAYLQHHTCGSVYRLMPDLINSGIQIINPVQPLAVDMTPSVLKKEFGDQLVFHGAIDIQQALTGSIEDVRAEVKQRIQALGSDGGYIVAPCSNFQADIPPENVIAMIEAAREFGKYPLSAQTLIVDGYFFYR